MSYGHVKLRLIEHKNISKDIVVWLILRGGAIFVCWNLFTLLQESRSKFSTKGNKKDSLSVVQKGINPLTTGVAYSRVFIFY